MFYAMRMVFGALSGLWIFSWVTADKPIEIKFQEGIGFLKVAAVKILSLADYLQTLMK
ncbi:MAG: hypothetical protein HQK84_01470 [Nitrospinae bacterium]|nr:hypothetical protein [Nitrospinota bacterium]